MNEMYIIGFSIITVTSMILSIIVLVKRGPVGPRGKDSQPGPQGTNGKDGAPGPQGPVGIMKVPCSLNELAGVCQVDLPVDLVVDGLTVGNKLRVGNNPDYKWDANGIQLGSPSNKWTPSGVMTSNLFVGSPSNKWTPSGIQLGTYLDKWGTNGRLTNRIGNVSTNKQLGWPNLTGPAPFACTNPPSCWCIEVPAS